LCKISFEILNGHSNYLFFSTKFLILSNLYILTVRVVFAWEITKTKNLEINRTCLQSDSNYPSMTSSWNNIVARFISNISSCKSKTDIWTFEK
jgi:hypothetical protein